MADADEDDDIQSESLLAKTLQTLPDVGEIQNHRSSNNRTALAVHMSNGFKSYGKFPVLKDLNLHVPQGSIYGLLGASGSGKTTILRCVVGRIALDTGGLLVFGKQPGSRGHQIPGRMVGYMPQEIALYREFSIDETLTFFGFLHGMKSEDVKRRRDFLIEFLDLPTKSRLVKNLSGGQQRRVSMSIALLQEPKLLILDEPTVGVDPLLREKIWDHLIDISKTSGTTIIITTHYIEEARKADYVGLIRYGRILAEQPPENLLRIHNESSLESVFLKLCSRDQDHTTLTAKVADTSAKNPVYESSDESFVSTPKAKPIPVAPAEPDSRIGKMLAKGQSYVSKAFRLPKLNNFLGLLYKDSILIRRNIGFLFFQFLIPVIQMSLFCLCIGREPYNLKFGIVNNETIYNSTSNSSWLYVNALDDKIFDKEYMDWSEAYRKTKKAELWGFLDLSANFTSDTTAKFIFHEPNKTYPGSNINFYLDSSNQQISYTIQLNANQAYQTFLQKFLGPFIDPSLFASPVVIQQPIYGDRDPQFINFMAPGIMVTIIFTLTIGLTALMFVIEKKEGLLDRGWAAGVSTLEIMMAHVASKLLIMTIQITLLILITNLVFNVKIKGPVIISALLLLLQGFCGMSYGLAISAGASNESDVMQIAIGSVFPALLLSGIIWPLEGMPHWVRMIANFSPLTHSAEAMRCIASRGWGFLYYPVWFGFVTVLGWSFLFDLVALIVFSATQG